MSRDKRTTADRAAALVVLAIGIPIITMGGFAFAENHTRLRSEEPRRGFVGPAAFDALARGEALSQHYMGNRLTAPDFSLPMEDGSVWTLSEHRGRVIVVNMWTITCGPCMEEMPSFIELAQIVRDRDDIELVTISVDRDWPSARTAVPADSGLTVLLDPDRSVVTDLLGTRQFPETWIIDRNGVIRLRIDGARDWSSALAVDVLETYL